MDQQACLVTECPECGEMRIAADRVVLRHCLDDDQWTYRFTCPVCERRAVVATSAERALLAVDAGLAVESWTLPTGRHDDESVPPLTYVDMLELHLALIEPDFIERLSSYGSNA